MHQKLTCQSSENQGTRAYNAASAFCEKKKKQKPLTLLYLMSIQMTRWTLRAAALNCEPSIEL